MSGQLPSVHMEEPAFLSVGTEVSAKYKGAFCEAKIKNISKLVKCKVQYLNGSVALVSDEIVKGTIKVGTTVQVKCNDKAELMDAIIQKVQDYSQYTVVFDDGDITCLKRNSLCLKSGRHFATSSTLDQLPLNHPEHIGITQIRNTVVNRRSRKHKKNIGETKKNVEIEENNIGKVVCVESNDKKKLKDNWFPGLIVSPTAQSTIKTNSLIDYLVRSFKDGKYYTVPKNEITEFTKEIASKVENPTLKTAVEKAILYLDKDEIPPHWDRDLLFGIDKNCGTDSDGSCDSNTSDEESIEEKDHFVAQLFKFMDDRGTPLNQVPAINDKDVDLYKLFKVVNNFGGYNKVNKFKRWKTIAQKVGHEQSILCIKQSYQQYLQSFEEFYRKLGCTMLSQPRSVRSRNSRFSRSIIRDIDKTQPITNKNGQSVSKQDDTKDSVKKSLKNTTKPEEKLSCKINDKKKDQITNNTYNNKSSVKCDQENLETTDSKIKKDDVEAKQIENLPINDKEKKKIYTKNLFGKSKKIKAIKKRIKNFVKIVTPFKKTKKNACNPQQEILNKKPDVDVPKLTRSKSKDDLPQIKRKLSVISNHGESPIQPVPSGINLENKIKNIHNGPICEKKKKKTDSKISTLLSNDVETLKEDSIISIGDNLIVYYGDTHATTYDAKVLNVCDIEGEVKYYVHYKGWNSRYDELIDRTRIALKCNHVEVDDTDSLKSEKKNIEQKKLEKPISRTRRSVTPSSNVSSNSNRKKSPFTINVRPTRTCTLNERSLAFIDNSDSETECLDNSGLTKQYNKKSYPSIKNIKAETDDILKIEPTDIDQKKKLSPKTYPTKEMLIQKLSPKKSCVIKNSEDAAEKIKICDHVILNKPFDFNFETETSISSTNKTSSLNNEYVETENIDDTQNELKIAPNHYLSPKEKSERHNRQIFNENVDISTDNAILPIKPKITGLVYYKSSSEDEEFELNDNQDKIKISGTDFDLNKIRSEMKGLTESNIDSYTLNQQVKAEDVKSTESTSDDIYEFKEYESCDFKTIHSVIENKHRRIMKHIESTKIIGQNESIILSNKNDKFDEKCIKTPNVKDNLIITDNTNSSNNKTSEEVRSDIINSSDIKQDSVNKTCHVDEVLDLCTKVPDLPPNNIFNMTVNDIEIDDDDDESKLIIAEVDKIETNCQIDIEHNSTNGQTTALKTQPLLHELSNTDLIFENSCNLPQDDDINPPIQCNKNVQIYTQFENQSNKTNVYQSYADNNDESTKCGFELELNSKSPTTEHTNNIEPTVNISIDESMNYDYENKKTNYIVKNENVIFPELRCKEELVDEDTLNNALVLKYSRKSVDHDIHKPCTSKDFFNSINQSDKDNNETDASDDMKNNFLDIQQANLIKNVIFDSDAPSTSKSIFYDNISSNNKDDFYETIPSAKNNSSFEKSLLNTNKKNYSVDGDKNNVLLCEETIPCSPTGIIEDHYTQEKISSRQETIDFKSSTSEEKQAASVMFAIKQSFNKPMISLMGATNEEINQYTDIIQNDGILDQRHLQFLAEISSRNAGLTINQPPELNNEPIIEQIVKVNSSKRKNSHEHYSVSKRNKISISTEDNCVEKSNEIKMSIPQKDGKPLVSFTPDMDSIQRQAIILAKINDLRKEYLLVKGRINIVDRRRKKIKKRKRELLKRSVLDKAALTNTSK